MRSSNIEIWSRICQEDGDVEGVHATDILILPHGILVRETVWDETEIIPPAVSITFVPYHPKLKEWIGEQLKAFDAR